MYHFHTKNRYKIWLSDEPDVFLDIENQLLWVEAISRATDTTFHFIYSSTCLSKKGLRELNAFCDRFGIIPLDFDEEVPELLFEAIDRELYELAKIEIRKTISKEGGSFACASDIIRLLTPLIMLCGIYEDFDTYIDYSEAGEFITAPSPILIKVEDSVYYGGMPRINNDRLAFAVDRDNKFKLDDSAILVLRRLQATLLSHYHHPAQIIVNGSHPDFINELEKECRFSHSIAKSYFELFPESSFVDFRKHIQHAEFRDFLDLLNDDNYTHYTGANYRDEFPLDRLKHNFGETLLAMRSCSWFFRAFQASSSADLAETFIMRVVKHRLLVRTVAAITGPNVLYNMHGLPGQLNRVNMYQYFSRVVLARFDAVLPSISVAARRPVSSRPLDNICENPEFHTSWTPEGVRHKQQRITRMDKAARVIQSKWEQFRLFKQVEARENITRSFASLRMTVG